MSTTPIRVLVVDDQRMLRESFAVLLNAQPDLEVVAEAANGEEAVRQARDLRPDVVLMDVRMPVLDGLEATRRILAHAPGTKVLVLTTFDDDEYVHEAIRAGANGFLLKDSSAHQLADAIRTTVTGGAVLAPSVTKRLMEDFSQRSAPPGAPSGRLAALTNQEIKVLGLVARGLSNAEIAVHLTVAEQTVKTHVSRILMKLNLRDRTQAAVLAYETGLITPGR
ncbi:response regulator [Actinoplanes regularis]|uniref:Two component transcriptional regulator, LuxR family n=1 Tax=Actinoplanes regularis TaxID=52697 RepID=A0A239ILP6_9ACTN|nr:response regulator transcription factor [Actinoplanes regularis]GIE91433.1 DNA-binding response regulator [Actinoplanes regularis]SNS94686.1 two component transcriptional regulator, LuxR family [Actinoplanes regularis]